MRWTPGGISGDIEDRRDDSGGFGGFGYGRLGCGGILILGILSLLFHRNLFVLFTGTPSAPVRPAPNRALDHREEPEMEFISFVLDDVQQNWDRNLPRMANTRYRHARLVLFRNAYP